MPWPVWLSELGIILESKKSLVQFLGGEYARAVDQVPSWGSVRGN